MEKRFQSIFKSEGRFFLTRLISTTTFFIVSFRVTDRLFYDFIIYEPLISPLSFLLYNFINVSVLRKFTKILKLLFPLIFIFFLVLKFDFFLLAFILVESFRLTSQFYFKRINVINQNLIISIFDFFLLFLVLFIFENYVFYFIAITTVRLLLFLMYKISEDQPAFKSKQTSSFIAILRNLFQFSSRKILLTFTQNPIFLISLKIVNQITLYAWSYIRSDTKFNFDPNKKIIYFLAFILSVLIPSFFMIINFQLKFLLYIIVTVLFVITELYFNAKFSKS
jgi:hypothetical protein